MVEKLLSASIVNTHKSMRTYKKVSKFHSSSVPLQPPPFSDLLDQEVIYWNDIYGNGNYRQMRYVSQEEVTIEANIIKDKIVLGMVVRNNIFWKAPSSLISTVYGDTELALAQRTAELFPRPIIMLTSAHVVEMPVPRSVR
jgi:hypothetical protein